MTVVVAVVAVLCAAVLALQQSARGGVAGVIAQRLARASTPDASAAVFELDGAGSGSPNTIRKRDLAMTDSSRRAFLQASGDIRDFRRGDCAYR